MQTIAEISEADYLCALLIDGAAWLEHATCQYIGVAQPDGSYDLHSPIQQYSHVGFRWCAYDDGFLDATVQIRPDDAVARGVCLPLSWLLVPECKSLQIKADMAAAEAREKYGLTKATCHVLGQSRPCSLADNPIGLEPGSVVQLCFEFVNVEFLLCAHVFQDLWICTQGHFDGDVFQMSDPFHECSLLLLDVRKNGWRSKCDPSFQYIKQPLRPGQLRALAVAFPDQWSTAVGVAIWRAEMILAFFQVNIF